MADKSSWTLGWILALGVLVVVGLVAWKLLFPAPSGPRETNEPGFLKLKYVEVDLADVLGTRPAAPGNAADDYQKACQICMTSWADIQAANERLNSLANAADPWSDPGLKAIKQIHDHVAAGAQKQKMEYTFVYTPNTLKFAYHYPAAERLSKVAVALNLLYMFHEKRKEYAEGEKVLKNMLILGVHMFEEHAIPHIGAEGLYVQLGAAMKLQELYGKWKGPDDGRLGLLKDYQKSVESIRGEYKKKKRILWDYIPATDTRTGKPRIAAGDVFNIAENDEDKAWQVQAIIALGALKFRAMDRGDARKTRSLIDGYSRSKDALFAAAAKAAENLTREQLRASGSSDF